MLLYNQKQKLLQHVLSYTYLMCVCVSARACVLIIIQCNDEGRLKVLSPTMKERINIFKIIFIFQRNAS